MAIFVPTEVARAIARKAEEESNLERLATESERIGAEATFRLLSMVLTKAPNVHPCWCCESPVPGHRADCAFVLACEAIGVDRGFETLT